MESSNDVAALTCTVWPSTTRRDAARSIVCTGPSTSSSKTIFFATPVVPLASSVASIAHDLPAFEVGLGAGLVVDRDGRAARRVVHAIDDHAAEAADRPLRDGDAAAIDAGRRAAAPPPPPPPHPAASSAANVPSASPMRRPSVMAYLRSSRPELRKRRRRGAGSRPASVVGPASCEASQSSTRSSKPCASRSTNARNAGRWRGSTWRFCARPSKRDGSRGLARQVVLDGRREVGQHAPGPLDRLPVHRSRHVVAAQHAIRAALEPFDRSRPDEFLDQRRRGDVSRVAPQQDARSSPRPAQRAALAAGRRRSRNSGSRCQPDSTRLA